MDGIKITGIRLQNFGCFELFEAAFGPGANIVMGDIAKGKTTLLAGLRAGLESVGVDPTAIRIGADKASVAVDLDALNEALKIRRSITSSGSTLAVTNDRGDKWARPQTRLSEMLGATLDPLAFYLAKPDERRRQILSAMPVNVTADDLKRWTGEDWQPTAGRHGLEVVADVRKHYYDLRGTANKSVKDAEAALKLANDEAKRLASDRHKGVVVPFPGEEDAQVRAEEKARESLEQKRQHAEAMAKRTEGTRAKIADLRAEAEAEDAKGVAPVARHVWEAASHALRGASANVVSLRGELALAEMEEKSLAAEMQKLEQQQNAHDQSDARSRSLRQQATQLEDTLAETAIDPPSQDDLAAADAAIAAAKASADLIRSARAAQDALAAAAALTDEVTNAEAEAKRLDDIVTTLTSAAPAELAARSEMIPGLVFDTDGGITLDGKSLNRLSGAEQMYFAIDLAKRVSKSKILIVDELHRLPEHRMREFARYAAKDGFQFIGAWVSDGELAIVAVDSDDGDGEALNPTRRVKVLHEGKEIA